MAETDDSSQQYIALLEAYKEQLETIETQSTYLQALINEYAKANITMENLGKGKKDADLLLPIGGGTFIFAKSADNTKVLVSIGADIVIEKTVEDATKIIDGRIQELQENLSKLNDVANQIQQKYYKISEKLQGVTK